MSDSQSIGSLIEQWPSLGDFARDARVSYGAAKQMRRRGSIPVDYWAAIIASKTGRHLGVTADGLLKLHSSAADLDHAPTTATEAA